MDELSPDFDDLGPLEDYLYLIDPSLKLEKKMVVPDINKLIQENMLNLERFEQLIEECDDLINAMTGADETHLNDLIKKINNLYSKLELENTNIPLTRLQALEGLKMKALIRRNIMRKEQLKLNDDYSSKINNAIKNNSITKPMVHGKNIHHTKALSDKGCGVNQRTKKRCYLLK